MYQIRGSPYSQPLKLRLCDTRGLEENSGIDAQELNYFLEGHVPDGYQVFVNIQSYVIFIAKV